MNAKIKKKNNNILLTKIDELEKLKNQAPHENDIGIIVEEQLKEKINELKIKEEDI